METNEGIKQPCDSKKNKSLQIQFVVTVINYKHMY